jgi:hypothetical protein
MQKIQLDGLNGTSAVAPMSAITELRDTMLSGALLCVFSGPPCGSVALIVKDEQPNAKIVCSNMREK